MRIVYTIHARERMRQRKVTEKQVEETLADPDEIIPPDNGGEFAIRYYGINEVRIVYEEIEDDTYLIFTVIRLRISR